VDGIIKFPNKCFIIFLKFKILPTIMEAESTDDILGPKKLNYEFLLLVRDKKYAEALTLGRKSTLYRN
jgi:hypothetical protein